MAGRAGTRGGTGHFWWQRLTAVALVPLGLWMLAVFIAYAGAPHAVVVEFLSRPVNAAGLLLLILAGLGHAMLGLQTVIEDYIQGPALRMTLLGLNTFFHAALGLACAVAALRLAFS